MADVTQRRLAQQIQAECIRRGYKVAVAESITAGNLQAALASISGSSGYFQGGITAYNVDQKVKHLGVDRRLAEQCNCVSTGTATEMADGVLPLFDADIAVATTGYAEPFNEEDGTAHQPHAYVAVCWRDGLGKRHTKMATLIDMGLPLDELAHMDVDREFRQSWVVTKALMWLLEVLKQEEWE